jgi:ABC-type phosphate transport system substrate-binding protein
MDSSLGSTQSTDKRAVLAQAVMIAMGVVTSIDASAATTTIFGGGATLPAAAYEGTTKADSTARLQTSIAASPGSLFQVYLKNHATVANTVSYCQTGSGTGRKVLDQSLLASGVCPAFTATPSGFGAPTAKPDFAASDAPLAQSDVNSVVAIAGATQPVQVPTVAASIAIAFHSVSGLSGTPSITDALLCSIFSGAVTSWSKVSPGASGNITVVYRSDGSGTSFSFSNHLSNVCTPPNASTYFTTDQTFTNVIAHAGAGGTLPKYAGAVSASGNPGVATALGTTTGGIAYVETQDAINRTGGALTYFKVQPKGGSAYYDPITNFAPTGKLTVSTTTNAVVSGVNSVGIAVLSAATGTTQGKCLIVANPASYNNFTTAYPIVGVSNLLSYYSGNAHKAAVSALLQQAAVQPAVNTIGGSKGYAYLTDSAGQVTTAIINSCIN